LYVVYVNHPNNKAIIHRAECSRYTHRRRDETINGYWRGPFENFSEAQNFAKKTGKTRVDTCAFCFPQA
jgi:hypothetical protein